MTTNSFAGNVWNTLSKIDVNKYVEKKGNLSYLSWAWAWGTLCKHYPESTYEFSFEVLGDGSVMTYVDLTIREGEKELVRKMWLPVMDNRNNAVMNPNARAISDTYMRCLVKAVAMCGLGHYIYAGDGMPEVDWKDQINNAANRDALMKVWKSMDAMTKKEFKAQFEAKGKTFTEERAA